MNRPVTSQELGIALCKVLDLNPDLIKSLTIEMDPGKHVTVAAIHFVTPGQAEGLAHLLSRYHLVPADDQTRFRERNGEAG